MGTVREVEMDDWIGTSSQIDLQGGGASDWTIVVSVVVYVDNG